MPLSNDLSKREAEVVQQLLEGKSNKMIAAALHITERTVEYHLKNIYARFQVSSRTELVLKLRESTVAAQDQSAENVDSRPTQSGATLSAAVAQYGREILTKMSEFTETRSEAGPMSFNTSIRTCFAKYAEFTGRASRPEFWWFALFVTLIAGALSQIHEIAANVFLIAVLLPLLAAGARRLRDTGKNPWWLLFLLVPVGGLVTLIIFWAMPPAEISS